ncbi:hypothetical protein PG991_016087 [Apiospora marii]|uniref:Uncharacterized protein n=1 Tax=Apiospora marii TaxID=335849 RepID=A0ABR1R175_9PEZI
MICNYLRPQDVLNLAQTCKSLSDNAIETLYRQHAYRAIHWACTHGTLSPLASWLRFHVHIDHYLDVSREESFGCNSAANTAAVVLCRPTPLILALAWGRFDVAEYLILSGANVNLPEGGGFDDNKRLFQPSRWFPIHFAVLQAQSPDRARSAIRVLKRLLDGGASANQQTLEGSPSTTTLTPLAQVMSSNAPLEALQLLLVYGADPLTMITTRVSWSNDGSLLIETLLRKCTNQRGGLSGREMACLKDKCALLLFSMPCEQSFNLLLESLKKVFDSPPQALEILYRAEELRVAVGSSRRPPICDRMDVIRGDRYASTIC